MNQQPLFSVLIANYNNGKYLMEAIASVRQQTYANWEIILVDDASTDNSGELYKELEKDERIRIYRNEQNMGCGFTKRRCAELAQGEICGFLDPDDALLPKALELMAGIHMHNPNISVVYSKCLYCDAEYNVIDKGNLPSFKKGDTYLDHRTHGAMNFTSYKKSYYDMTDGINPNLKAGVDQDLYFRIEEVGEIYLLDEYTYKYVIKGHPQAISRGEDNKVPLWYWNMVARRDAFVRRGRCEDDLVEDLRACFYSYAEEKIRKNNQHIIERLVQRDIKNALYMQELQIRSSKPYRLGRSILRPVYWIKNLLGK